jgi:hypothetical protein
VGDVNVAVIVPTVVSTTWPGSNGTELKAGPVTFETSPAYRPSPVFCSKAISHHGCPEAS